MRNLCSHFDAVCCLLNTSIGAEEKDQKATVAVEAAIKTAKVQEYGRRLVELQLALVRVQVEEDKEAELFVLAQIAASEQHLLKLAEEELVEEMLRLSRGRNDNNGAELEEAKPRSSALASAHSRLAERIEKSAPSGKDAFVKAIEFGRRESKSD